LAGAGVEHHRAVDAVDGVDGELFHHSAEPGVEDFEAGGDDVDGFAVGGHEVALGERRDLAGGDEGDRGGVFHLFDVELIVLDDGSGGPCADADGGEVWAVIEVGFMAGGAGSANGFDGDGSAAGAVFEDGDLDGIDAACAGEIPFGGSGGIGGVELGEDDGGEEASAVGGVGEAGDGVAIVLGALGFLRVLGIVDGAVEAVVEGGLAFAVDDVPVGELGLFDEGSACRAGLGGVIRAADGGAEDGPFGVFGDVGERVLSDLLLRGGVGGGD
jgi:hypothetical protein